MHRTIRNLSLFAIVIFVQISCATEPDIVGLWKSTGGSGSIEFKATGEVVIVDNMSATVSGSYEIGEDNLITFELTASDILRDSVEPVPKTIVTAYIMTLDRDRLQLRFPDEETTENYRRIH